MRGILRRAAAVAPAYAWALVAATFAISVVVSLARFRRWGPDSRYYLAWAYRYGGLSEEESGRRAFEFLGGFPWFEPFCHGACGADAPASAYDQLFHGVTGSLVAPRVLYPLLSAPFVRLLGPEGMLVVPVISMAVCVVLVMVLASRLFGPGWAMLAGVATVLPATVSRFATYAYTEALTMALCLACVVVLPLGWRTTRRHVVLFAVFLFLFAFTRQFHLIVVTGVGLAWVGAAVSQRRLSNEWLPFLATGIAVTALCATIQGLLAPGFSLVGSFLRLSGAETMSGVPAAVARVSWQILKAETWYVSADMALVIIGVIGLAGLMYRFRSSLCLLALGVIAGTFVLNVLNTEPSNFRYYTMAFPLLALTATGLIADLVGGRGRTRPAPPAAPGAQRHFAST